MVRQSQEWLIELIMLEPEFSRFVEMLNSDNLDKTMELVISQTSKLKGYIEKSKNSSLGGDPSAK